MCETSDIVVNPAMPVLEARVGELVQRAGPAINGNVQSHDYRAGFLQNFNRQARVFGQDPSSDVTRVIGGWQGDSCMNASYDVPQHAQPHVASQVLFFCATVVVLLQCLCFH